MASKYFAESDGQVASKMALSGQIMALKMKPYNLEQKLKMAKEQGFFAGYEWNVIEQHWEVKK